MTYRGVLSGFGFFASNHLNARAKMQGVDNGAAFQRHAAAVPKGWAPPQQSGEDNLKTLAVFLAACEAAAANRVFDLNGGRATR